MPSPVAANTTPPAVASTPAASDPRLILYSHFVPPVSGSMALMLAVEGSPSPWPRPPWYCLPDSNCCGERTKRWPDSYVFNVHPTRLRTVGGRLPVGAAYQRRIHGDAALGTRIPAGHEFRPAVVIEARVPSLAHERRA